MQAGVYKVIGLMSGTSLDGLDIAYCRFEWKEVKWSWEIIAAETVSYSDDWKSRLLSLENTDALSFQQAHVEYGTWLGQRVSDFVIKHGAAPDLIASHGHTIFHQPEKKLTVQ